MSKVMVILVIHLQFHISSPPSEVQFLQLWNIQALIPLSLHAQADTQAVLAQSHHSPSAHQ